MAADSRNVDYATKYAKELDQLFTKESQTLVHMKSRGEYKEDGGVASVYFRTVDTSDFIAGHTSALFGDPTETNSDVVRKDVDFFYETNKMLTAVQIDDTAGAMKEGGRIMNVAIMEQYTPLIDKIALGAAINAATAYGGANVVTYDETDVITGIGEMAAALKQQRSYAKNQTLFIAASVEPLLNKNLFTSYTPSYNDGKARTGEQKQLLGIDVEIVPDEFFNTMTTTGTSPYAQAAFTAAPNVKAVLWDNRVMGSVNKLKSISILTGDLARAAGADGAVLRALYRPGAWVFDANGKKKGVAILQSA
ncbi:MAG: hypothetical protein ACK5MU_04030 [Candidatus Saccharimonadales bacterium]